MFNLNLLNILTTLIPKLKKQRQYEPATPGEIKKIIQNLNRCPNCHFIIFDNYWSDEIGRDNLKICPTCGTF